MRKEKKFLGDEENLGEEFLRVVLFSHERIVSDVIMR